MNRPYGDLAKTTRPKADGYCSWELGHNSIDAAPRFPLVEPELRHIYLQDGMATDLFCRQAFNSINVGAVSSIYRLQAMAGHRPEVDAARHVDNL